MQAIAYEWGSPIHPKAQHKDVSPDDAAQAQLASSLSGYGVSQPASQPASQPSIRLIPFGSNG